MSGFRLRQLPNSPLWSIGAGYYSPKLNQVARSVPGMRFDSKLKAHVGYVDAVEQVVLRLRELGLNADDPPENERKWPHNLPVSYEGAREYQREGIDFLINQSGSGAFLCDDMGIGKAQPLDANVLTPIGWRRIGDLKVGDVVADPDGGVGEVTGVYAQGEREVFRVTTADGESTECCGEHLWLVQTPNDRTRGGKSRVLALNAFGGELRGESGNGQIYSKWFVPVCAPIGFKAPIEGSHIDPYLLGALLGDGCFRAHTTTFTSADPSTIRRVKNALPHGLTLKRGGRYGWRITHGKPGEPNCITDALRELGLYGKGSSEKHVPPTYMHGRVEDRLALLRGLMDTDGTCGKRGACTFTSTSRRLADDVADLVRSLGGIASTWTRITRYTHKGKKKSGRRSWTVSVRLPANPFSLKRKMRRWSPPKLARAIAAVEAVGVKETRCIRVSTKRRLYVTDGYIVTHNSFQTVKAVRALRRKTIIVCESHVRGVWEREPELDDRGGELAKWWPKANVFKPYGVTPSPVPPKADVVVIHYDIIYAWVDVLLEWAAADLTIVFDEFQVLLNPTSRRSEACRTLAHAARGRVGLSGTPPVDKIKNLHNAVETICPGRFGEFFPFAMRYAGALQKEVDGPEKTKKLVWDFSGRSNIKELRQRLDWFCLRRTKREVMKELPALQRQIVDVEVPPKFRIAINARLVGDRGQMRRALDSAADGKLKSVLELIRGHLEAGQRVIVGTYRRAICEKIADAIGEYAPTKFIHGGIPLTRRNKIIAALRRVEGPVCLVTNIDCTKTGIDLTFANVGVIAELVWEPHELVQWEARAHRFGASTEEPVLMQYVIARGTGDELILHAVINKLDNFLDLVETDAGDGLKEALVGEKDEGLSRLAAALKKMGRA